MIDLTPQTEEEIMELESAKNKAYKNLILAVTIISIFSLTLSTIVSYMTIKAMRK